MATVIRLELRGRILRLGLGRAENLPYQITLVTFEIFWYRTKEITQGALNLTDWVRLYSNQASHRCIFIRMCTSFLTRRTLADNVRLISRAQHLGCKADGTCWLKCGVV